MYYFVFLLLNLYLTKNCVEIGENTLTVMSSVRTFLETNNIKFKAKKINSVIAFLI